MKRIAKSIKQFLFGKWCILPALFCGCQSMKVAQENPEPLPAFVRPEAPVKFAVVLGSGGSKGLAHVGVLRELEEAGIHPDLIVGCSSGALIGALYADKPDVSRLESLLLEIRRSDLVDFSIFSSRFGIVKGDSLQKFLASHLSARTFSELKIPLIVVTTDLGTGEQVELGGGELIPALEATSAIPGVFRPKMYLGRFLVDGGVVNPVPADVARKYGAKVILAVDVGEGLPDERPSHLFGVARRGLEISHRALTEYGFSHADLVIKLNFKGMGVFNDRYNQTIYDVGRKKTHALLPQIKQMILDRLSHQEAETSPSWLSVD